MSNDVRIIKPGDTCSSLEAAKCLEALKKQKVYAQFACTNPHWWIGSNKDCYWYNYYCCDSCDNYDWEEFDNIDDIIEKIKDFSSEWVRLED